MFPKTELNFGWKSGKKRPEDPVINITIWKQLFSDRSSWLFVLALNFVSKLNILWVYVEDEKIYNLKNIFGKKVLLRKINCIFYLKLVPEKVEPK